MKFSDFLLKIFNRKNSNLSSSEHSDFRIEKEDMIRGIVELGETTVKDVIVPRIDVAFIPKSILAKELFEIVTDCGYSRFPVYEETIDNVIGVLYVKDLFKYMLKDGNISEDLEIEKIIRKPYFVPESKRLDTLLREFKRRRVHIAIAVDEYGGVSGIVCMEDIIEEIVGDIQDEFDNEEEDIIEIGSGVYLCDARIDLEDLNEIIKISIPEEEFDTLGGFVFGLLGKIPVKFEKVIWEGIEFIVQDVDGHKIKTVKVVVQNNDEN